MRNCGCRCALEISRLHKQLGTTMIYVTHDQTEAMTLADKIVVLRAGNIEQVGAPLDLYDDPATVSSRVSSVTEDEFSRRHQHS